MRPILPAALVAALALAPVARADDEELLSSVYTENGYELRQDNRLFTLFAAFNAAGFVRADTTREQPFPRAVFHPIREKLRQALIPVADKLRPPVDVFLDTHALPIETYIEAVLALGDEPEFAATEALSKDLKGLDKVLADFSRHAKAQKLARGLTSDYRNEFKRLREALDKPFADLRAAFRLKEEDAPALVLMPNPLDASSAAIARRAPDGSHVVVFGVTTPDRPVDVRPALRAYAALLAEEAVATIAIEGAVTEAVEALKAGGALAGDVKPRAWLAESFRAVVEARLWSKDPIGDVELAVKRGFVLAREFLKAAGDADDVFPADRGPYAAQIVGRVDLKKAVGELVKAPEPAKAPGKK